jgi:long-chain acyl-CoA synthetase
MQNLVRGLRSAARHHGSRPALLDASRTVTWTEFEQRVACAAGALRALGVEPGARFGILARNGFRHEELKWAGIWLGAVPVPINFRLAPPEIAHILEDAWCTHVLVETPFLPAFDHPSLAAYRDRLTHLGETSGAAGEPYEQLLAAAAPAAPCDPALDADAILLYTGGTTGRGKGVRLSHGNVVASSLGFALGTGARPDQVYCHAAPMFHSASLLATGWMLQGAAQCFLPMFSPAAFLETIRRYRVGAVVTVPTMLIATLSDPAFAKADVSSLRVLIYGAAPMAVEWIDRVAAAFPDAALYNCYGLTETGPDITVFDAAEFRAAIEHFRRTGERLPHLTSIGKPNVLNEVRVVAPDGRELPAGEVGELVVRGRNVMLGYLNRPEETRATLRDGWLHTGDVARIDADGYVHLLDRLKDMVITGGENVYSSEVEEVLFAHPAVQEAAVIGIPDARLGEMVMAVIALKPGAAATEDEIVAHCRASLGGFKVPRRLAFLPQLPKSAVGKVLKTEIRKQFAR